MDCKTIKELYNMRPHPEGGWFAELWQSSQILAGKSLCSQIYYLLEAPETCQWHRLTSEELWLFHHGAPLTLYLGGNGPRPREESAVTLGENLFHCLVPAGQWQKAVTQGEFTLVSCVVTPAYQRGDWEMLV